MVIILCYLPDYLDFNLKIIFVGYNPGEKSAILGQHYAGRGNQFWKLLFESGLTSRLYKPEESQQLLSEGYGLTNIVSRPSKSSSDLTLKEMEEGAIELNKKMQKFKPLIICFLGKEIYRKYENLKPSTPINYGIAYSSSNKQIILYIAPNPSGRSTIPYTMKLDIFKKLYTIIKTL
jgi:mismatch-specific thymine-DNA glycosylase